jgi:hypothetical protein
MRPKRPKKPILKTAILMRDRLVYDINFETWKIAGVRIEDKVLQSKTSTDEEADMWIESKFQDCIDLLKGKLMFCLDHVTKAGDVTSNELEANSNFVTEEDDEDESIISLEPEVEHNEFPVQYVFGFAFSVYWHGNIKSIARSLHDYIVAYTLGEWFALVKPDEAARYMQKADKHLSDVINFCRQEDCRGITFRL